MSGIFKYDECRMKRPRLPLLSREHILGSSTKHDVQQARDAFAMLVLASLGTNKFPHPSFARTPHEHLRKNHLPLTVPQTIVGLTALNSRKMPIACECKNDASCSCEPCAIAAPMPQQCSYHQSETMGAMPFPQTSTQRLLNMLHQALN